MTRIAAVVALLAAALWAPPALACESFANLGADELKSYRDKLVEEAADPIDRLFAFQQLICSSSPAVRAYAVREGLRTSTDPLVRHQIMLDALMQKQRLDVEMAPGPDATKADKEFAKEHSGVLVYPIAFVSATEGCLSLSQRDRCTAGASAHISGDKLELIHGYLVGEFRLTEGNELVGYVRASANANYSRIPAVVRLD